MYASRVKDQNLTFAVSGKLWKRSLVMIDQETKSLWSHLLGEAMDGELKGATLESIASVITDWATWHRAHPGTTVLKMSHTSRNYERTFYAREGLGKFVLGTVAGGRARSWPLERLAEQPVVNDEFLEVPLLVAFDRDSITAHLYDRRVGDRVLTFRHGDRATMTDVETGSQWNMSTGEATAGALAGSQLKPVVAILSFAQAWESFHPDASSWKE